MKMAFTSVFILAPDFPEQEGFGAMLSGKYEESLVKAKELGYDGVEIIMGDPERFDAEEFKKLLASTGLKVSAVNSGSIQYTLKSGLVSSDSRQAQLSLETLHKMMLVCQDLGCVQQVGVARGFIESGRPMRWFKDCLVDVLRTAAAYAADLRIEIAFEYTNRHEINTINTVAEAREIIERVGSNRMGMLLDTYHSYLEDPDSLEAIYDSREYLRHIHLHDSNGGAAIIGGGETNFERLIELCGEIGYSRWFSDGLHTLEYGAEEVRRSTSVLRSLYERYIPAADPARAPVR